MKKIDPKTLLRNLIIELAIYSALIIGYYLAVLRWLDEWLLDVFTTNIIFYSLAGLGLIVIQAVVLDFITSFLMKYFKLDQFGVRRILDVFSNR